MISLIYARSLNHCIGDKGAVPWQLPDEFAHFEQTTMGKPIIMGRKTYEDHKSVLPGRLNIVISRQPDYQTAAGVRLVHSLPDAIDLASTVSSEVFIIGGANLFSLALPQAALVYETIINAEIVGDTIMPDFDFSDWQTELMQDHPTDQRHEFSFKVYRHGRRQPQR